MSLGIAVLHDDVTVLDDLAYAIDRTDGIHLSALGEVKDADVVLVGGPALPTWRPAPHVGLVALSTGDPVEDARAGFEAGARGFLRWPADAEDLPRIVARAAFGRASRAERGAVVVVAGARGGAGATVVAALLARQIPEAVLVDLDPGAGQLAFAPEGAGGGLERAISMPLPDVIGREAGAHASGRALLRRPGAVVARDAARTLIASAREVAPVVVVDAGRARIPWDVEADATILVCANDIASLRFAREWISLEPAAKILLNCVHRRGVRRRLAAEALGREPAAVLPRNRALARAPDVGVLPSERRTRFRHAQKALVDVTGR